MDSFLNKIWKESFKVFYRKYSKPFWLFIFKMCGEASMADDIFQESFLRFLKASPVELNEYQKKSYLYKTATRLIIDQKKRIQIEKKKYLENNPEKKKKNFFLSMDMEKIFKQLKPKERTLLWLAYVEGYSHREISEITHLKEKSIKVQLFRTRKKFAGILRQKGYTGGELV